MGVGEAISEIRTQFRVHKYLKIRKIGRGEDLFPSFSSRLLPSASAAASSRRFRVLLIGLLVNPKDWTPAANCTTPSGRSILRIGYPVGNWRIHEGVSYRADTLPLGRNSRAYMASEAEGGRKYLPSAVHTNGGCPRMSAQSDGG